MNNVFWGCKGSLESNLRVYNQNYGILNQRRVETFIHNIVRSNVWSNIGFPIENQMWYSDFDYLDQEPVFVYHIDNEHLENAWKLL